MQLLQERPQRRYSRGGSTEASRCLDVETDALPALERQRLSQRSVAIGLTVARKELKDD